MGVLVFLFSKCLREVLMVIHPVVFRLQKELKKYLQRGKSYVVAVSGGADSLALAHAASTLNGFGTFTVCHVEHGIRGNEALLDAEFVENFCKEHNMTFYCCHVDALLEAKTKGMTLEEAARNLRYAALRNLADKIAADAILTAHHKDDQAETVLLKLLRGAGLDGLGAMEFEHEDIIRPWLKISRSELEEYCRLNNLEYHNDSTNSDMNYTRNRVRLELLPYLKKTFNPNIADTLARTASLLQEDAECLEQMMLQAYGKIVVNESNDTVALHVYKLLELPAALRKRVLRQGYFALGGKELSFERTEALELLCQRGTGGKLLQLPEGISACYKNKMLVFNKQY